MIYYPLPSLLNIHKQIILFSFIVYLIGLPSIINGQNQFDTSVIRKKPCKVQKITMKYDTTLKLENENWKCPLKFSWPQLHSCESFRIDSSLNNTLKTKGLKLLDQKSAKELCTDEKIKGMSKFSIERFDKEFLSLSFYYRSFYFGGTLNSHSITFHYDFEKRRKVALSDILKPDRKEEFFEIIKKRFYKKFDYNARPLEFNRFLNKPKTLVVYLDDKSGKKIKLKKSEISKFLRKEYYANE